MRQLDIKKKKAMKLKMQSNIMDCEIKIEERKEEIQRLEAQIVKYQEEENKLEEELASIEE